MGFQSLMADQGLITGLLRYSLVYSDSGCQRPSSTSLSLLIITGFGRADIGFVGSSSTVIALVGHSLAHIWHPVHLSWSMRYGFSIIHYLGGTPPMMEPQNDVSVGLVNSRHVEGQRSMQAPQFMHFVSSTMNL